MGTVVWIFQRCWEGFLDLLYPPFCLGCNRAGFWLCDACLDTIPTLPHPHCFRCHDPQKSPQLFCRTCSTLRALRGIRACSIYDDLLKEAIFQLKYGRRKALAEPLGWLLATCYSRYRLAGDLLTCVPLHPKRSRERGFNQAELLARSCANFLKLPFYPQIFERLHFQAVQAQQSLAERRRNMQEAFRVAPESLSIIQGKRLILIDDVSTTTTTLESCAQVAQEAGATLVWGLVLARPLHTHT